MFSVTPTRTRTSERTAVRRLSVEAHREPTAFYPDDQAIYFHEQDTSIWVSDYASNDSAEDVGSKEKVEEHTDEELGDHADEDADKEGSREAVEERDDRSDIRDVEKARPHLSRRTTTRSKKEKDPNIVSWEGPEDPENPKNWSKKRRWAATLIVSGFTFISPVSSSMVAPALGTIAAEFHITDDVISQLSLSIFVLAYAVGPLFLGPLSEVFGRVPVLQLANLFYLCFNLGCGLAQSTGQLLAFRFLAGLGGSAPLAIGGGVLGDCWRPEQRGQAVGIYSLAPLLGPALGPIAGGFITQHTSWRWVFYATCIVTVVIQIAGLFFLQETYAPKLLEIKARKLRKQTGNNSLRSEFYQDITLWEKLKHSLVRPVRMLATQPIVQVLAVYMAYVYGLIYLVLSTFPGLWSRVYHESIGIGGLNYISIGIGLFLGAQITARANDRVYRYFKERNNGVGKPEFRCLVMLPGAALIPAGLFWYGWSAEAHTHWILPNIGVAIFHAGCICSFTVTQSYIIDTYTRYAASAVAAVAMLRALCGFGFPLFAPAMYNALGYGWGNGVLAFVSITIGLPAPVLLWRYGAFLRAKSQYAAGG